MRKIFILVNPVAGGGETRRRLPMVEKFLKQSDFTHHLFLTNELLRTKQTIKTYLDDSYTDIVVMGGDGTLHDVINSLDHFNRPIALIPTGTANDFVKSWPRKLSFKQYLDRAINGNVESIDLGICNQQYFHNGVGMGFDGAVAARANDIKVRGKAGLIPYWHVVLKLLFSYKSENLTVSIPNKDNIRHNAFLATVGNGISFGGGFKLTPKANLQDGKLDLCIIDKLGVGLRLWRLPFATMGKHLSMKMMHYFQSDQYVIQFEKEVPAHIDGEHFSADRYAFSIAPGQLKLRR